MRFDLESGTDAGLHALYDPGAICGPAPDRGPAGDWGAWVRGLEESGRVFTYNEGGDGMIRLKLVVDEPFDDPGQVRKDVLEGAVLRVPTGRVRFEGIENVSGDPESDPPVAEVPPGNYAVSAFRVDWDLPDRRVRQERDEMLRPGDWRFVSLFNNCAVPLGCATMIGMMAGAAIVMISAGFRLRPIGQALLGICAVILVLSMLAGSRRMRRWNQAERELWRRYPHFVVQLTRLPDDEIPERVTPGRYGAWVYDEGR